MFMHPLICNSIQSSRKVVWLMDSANVQNFDRVCCVFEVVWLFDRSKDFCYIVPVPETLQCDEIDYLMKCLYAIMHVVEPFAHLMGLGA